jgi:hypothetical protein
MIPDPVVLDVRDPAAPLACADVLRTTAPTAAAGSADAARLFGLLPGLAMVAVVLPGDRIAFLTRRGHLGTAAWRPMLAEHVYAWWVASSSSCARTASACGDSSDR